jgi:hypothetical protein
MPDPQPQPEFLMRFEAERGPVPCMVRLRRLLKALLRCYGFRLVDVLPVPGDAEASPGTPDANGDILASARAMPAERPNE